MEKYDVIVVGAGHAGSEAAIAAAKLGSSVLLVTMDMTKIAQMSCNPAMGGIAKGQIIREMDAMGGMSGVVTDRSMIQFRMLNRSKGPAMWSPRAQCDRMLFSWYWREELEKNERVHFWQDVVTGLEIKKHRVHGVKTLMGNKFSGKTVILTSGTFLNGLIHIGKQKAEGGRIGELPSKGITEQLRSLGMKTGRMKTGTPARIDGRTVNFAEMIEQKGDEEGGAFSYMTERRGPERQKSCYIVHTDQKVHEIIRKGIKYSPLFDGTIQSIGPRYCPSIEDKIVTFSEKERHQLFLEPEGWNTVEYYLNGFSSSLPWEVQYEAMKNIRGLEKVKIFRPGYAIEYDYFDPTQLKHTLESNMIEGLFMAGQVNGTTGYEEAGAQGLISGINAHAKCHGKEEFVLGREEGYIGVLIDDLVSKGVDEPYRMFTSRAEYRMLLRQDNADERLTEKAYRLGMVTDERMKRMEEKYRKRDKMVEILNKMSLRKEEVNPYLESIGSSKIKQTVKAKSLILRPEVTVKQMALQVEKIGKIAEEFNDKKDEIIESVEIFMKYKGYVEREKLLVEKMKRLENIQIPEDIRFDELSSISTEARQKLNRLRPKTIGQASRISGVSPSDIHVLLVYMRR
ncbi:MAG TPA: tRNA uridine-5-carboxymethylaminomethyl(34) synthesis enzyme MnmG [Bacteroidetes bacterium]|nr:tRNA uridine-5-carboxymethylaminomethyl(34) synthesis enzyme MnmG [Bacteroidota bacterium]